MGLDFQADHPELVHRMSYEELVTDPEKSIQGVMHFLGLEYEAAMLDTTDSQDEYSTFYRDIHVNLGSEPRMDFIDKWRDGLTTREIQIVEWINQDLMTQLGYSKILPPTPPSTMSVTLMRIDRLFKIFRQTWRYIRYRPHYLSYLLRRKYQLGLLRDFLWKINY
jgi:hypothetical protein